MKRWWISDAIWQYVVWLLLCGLLIGICLLWLATSTMDQGFWLLERKAQDLDSLLLDIEILQDSDPEMALQLADLVRMEANARGNRRQLGMSYYWLSRISRDQEKFSENIALAIEYVRISTSIFAKLKQPYWQAKSQILLAENCAFLLRQDASSWDTVQMALNQAESAMKQIQNQPIDSLEIAAEILRSKGTYAMNRYDFSQEKTQADQLLLQTGMTQLQQSFEIYDQLDHLEGMAICQRLTGTAHALLGQSELAIQALEDAISLDSLLGSAIALQNSWRELGDVYLNKTLETGSVVWMDTALSAYQQALQTNEQPCQSCLDIGYAYFWWGIYADPQYENQKPFFDSVDVYFMRGVNHAKAGNDQACLKEILKHWYQLCHQEERDNCEAALPLADSAYQQILAESKKVLHDASSQVLDFEKREMRRLESRKRFLLLTIGAIVILGLLLLFLLMFRRIRTQYLRRLASEQEQKLQARMNPHFISNSLNAIDYLIYNHRNREASKYLVRFSRLARLVMEYSGMEAIPLKDEVDVLRSFLEMEELRLNGWLTFEIQVDPQLNQRAIMIPPMLLQPFVENAVWHGIRPKETAGKLWVSFQEPSPDTLLCIVEDNGVGRSKEAESRQGGVVEKKTSSTELIQKRISILKHIRNAKLRFIDLTDDQTGASLGTRVELSFHLTQQ